MEGASSDPHHSSPVVILKSGQVIDETSAPGGGEALLSTITTAEAPTLSLRISEAQYWSIVCRAVVLGLCTAAWLLLSCLDARYTPRDPNFVVPPGVITSYQWCFVGYVSNMILTLIKVAFEAQPAKIKLHMVSCYINMVAAGSYAMLWTGFSPIVPDLGSCLFIPQRWLLYTFTVPAIFHILGQISDYTPSQKLWVDILNVFIMVTGGFGTIPWLDIRYKVFWYIVSPIPFPWVLSHMWRMMSHSLTDVAMVDSSKSGIKFVRLFTIGLYWSFPIMYYGSILGLFSVEVLEPFWAALDWLIKMVYSSSLMETNFFVVQRRESVVRAVEEANKIKTIQELSTAIERKDDFLSTMSHELRTPLNGIIGLSESLELGSAGQLPDKALQVLSSIKHSGRRLLQLINDVLDAAKMKQGQLVIKREQVDVRLLVGDVLDISAMLVRRGVKLVNNCGQVPVILGDTGRIVQILYNLVGNAAKFTKVGSITVSSGVSKDRHRLFIAVTDTGCGVPKDKISKIFGAFEQADMSTTRHYGGTGLGLHLVKELVKAHHGDITVESEVGRGSTFTVWLPINGEGHLPSTLAHPAHVERPSNETLSASLACASPLNSQGLLHHPSASSLHSASLGVEVQDQYIAMTPRRGSVQEASAPLRNTSFSYLSPGHPDTRTQTAASPPAAVPPAPSKSQDERQFASAKGDPALVLSVDDDPINQMVVENLLTPDGFEVEQAMDGSEALRFLAESTVYPDVILLDVMMPGMNGFEVCREIRSLYSANIPIIMVSAKGNPEDVREGLQSGAQDYIKKPFQRQELLSRVHAQLKQPAE